ncbi:response regulator [Mangrovimonas futianensis]|uniref:response regulator n=1 Tax=Mangrovimonas futianensis TaxID=2895523 RepID=UPI001E3981BB|nr:response regulator [Mangrovimonas futianensis]MCF1420840.1 response regulator [Mangrovimonas futianensis]
MNILVFENEIQEVFDSFNDVNYLDFSNKLKFTFITKSQDFKEFRKLENYSLIFVDIDLSIRSEKDGFGLISDLNAHNQRSKIIILTGNDISDQLKHYELSDIPVLEKPVIHSELTELIKKMTNENNPSP